ncbi:hypothetical protein V5F49_06455 [Xanthobacter sp. V3C-3]|uniref:hypothetical protein n=1 Tax=Xanthobacter lutulentifluminis TaxID=3119935 RepID=UPI00372C1EE1
MADYYPLLVRAISSLPQKTGEGRRAVYDRARTALMRQLRGVDPPLPEGEITRERMSLEEAIRRVEAEYAQQDNAAPEPDEDDDAVEEVAAPAPVPPRPPAFEPPARPFTPPRPAAEAEPARAPEPAEADAAEPPARSERRLPPRPRDADEDADGEARPPRRGEVRSRGSGGPRLPARGETTRPSVKKFVLWTVAALLVLGGIAFAVVNRDLILGGSGDQRPAAPAVSGSAEQPKSADRISANSGDAARRAPSQAPRATGSNTARAVLMEETPGGAQPQTFEGTVTWKTETVNAGPGLPPDIGLRGDVVIPERKIAMSFVLRRNTDQTLPASHTIELGFKLPDDFPFGGIANVEGVRMKPNQQALGTPLAGLAVRVNPTLFLVGLSEKTADRQRNVTLLQAYPWMDVLIAYTNSKKALLAFEKGPAGEQAFNDAFSAWGELLQRPPAQPATQNGG